MVRPGGGGVDGIAGCVRGVGWGNEEEKGRGGDGAREGGQARVDVSQSIVAC